MWSFMCHLSYSGATITMKSCQVLHFLGKNIVTHSFSVLWDISWGTRRNGPRQTKRQERLFGDVLLWRKQSVGETYCTWGFHVHEKDKVEEEKRNNDSDNQGRPTTDFDPQHFRQDFQTIEEKMWRQPRTFTWPTRTTKPFLIGTRKPKTGTWWCPRQISTWFGRVWKQPTEPGRTRRGNFDERWGE